MKFYFLSLLIFLSILTSCQKTVSKTKIKESDYSLALSLDKKGDYSTAAKLFKKSCLDLHAPSCTFIGWYHEMGKIGKKDSAKAKNYYKKACDLDGKTGCGNLGNFYQYGKGVKKDLEKAKKYYEKACDLFNGRACNDLGIIYFNKKKYKEAINYYSQACADGNKYGCNNLGYCYEHGLGDKKEISLAYSQYEYACELGYKKNCKRLPKTNAKIIQKYLNTGFEKQALEHAKNLIYKNDYHYFKHFIELKIFKTFPPSFRFYMFSLWINNCLQKGINDDRLLDAVENYATYASHYGYPDLIPTLIKTYKDAIGYSLTKKQKDYITIFNATYLLDKNQDEKAYDLIFKAMPLSEDVKRYIKFASKFKYGLNKNIKKLLIATNIKELDYTPRAYKKEPKYLYDLNLNKVYKNKIVKIKAKPTSNTKNNINHTKIKSSKKKKNIKTQKTKAKNDAIRLLD